MRSYRWRPAASLLSMLLLLSCGDDIVGPDYEAIYKVVVTADPSTKFFTNETLQLHASFEDVDGKPVTGPPVTWKSVNSHYMQVSPTGLVTAAEPSRMTITASANGRLGEIMLESFSPQAPGEPSSFHARAVSDTEIQMAWRSGRGWTEEFRIERETVVPIQAEGSQEPPAAAFATLAVLPDTARGDFALPPNQTYRYRVQACNRHGCSGYSPTVSAATFPTLHIETAALPVGHLGVPYSVSLEGTTGTGPLAWSVVAGALPPGLRLEDARLLGGPTKAGTFSFTLRATGAGQSVDRAFSLEISDAPVAPIITTTTLPEGIVGQSYLSRLHAGRGDGNFVWSVASGSLPPGLTLAANGEISGTPSAIGKFAFTVEVTSAAMTGKAELVLDVAFPPVVIDLIQLPRGKRGDPYSETLRATGGDGVNFVWSIVSGQLPPGLTLGATTGAITGTPTTGGFFPFTVRVTSGGRTATQGLYIDTTDQLVVENWYLPVAIQGTPYTAQIAASGGDGSNYVYKLIGGVLPPLFSLNPSTGVISGTPTGTAGTFFFTVEVQSGTLKLSRSFSLTVSSVGVEGFNVAVMNVSSTIPPATFMTALDEAIRKWESIITTDFPSFTIPGELGSEFCQGHGHKLRAGDVIEDFVILLGVYSLDGPSGVLGRAGPCGYVLGDPMMFRAGSVLMDEADIPNMNSEQLRAVAGHEIGHALGIGTMWDFGGRNLITGKGEQDPRYTGLAGVEAYRSLGGRDAAIAVENIGDSGTRDGHWREATFDNEMMTGFIEPAGVPMPLSRMTVRSLADLGYTVNADRADSYTVPLAALAAVEGERRGEPIELRDDVVIEPFIRVLPGGSLRLERPR